VINKADGANRAAAERARIEAQNALHYFPSSASLDAARPTCSTQTGHGISELWNCVLEHTAVTQRTGWFAATRHQQTRK